MKKLLRYYKNYTLFMAIGALFLIVGALLYYFSWELWALSTPALIVGVAFLVFAFAMRVSDQTYGAYFTGKVDAVKSGRRVEVDPVYTATEYSFEGNTYARLDSTQKPRSERYVHTDIYFDKTTLGVECFRVDLVADSLDNDKHSFALAEVTASIEEKELRVNGSLKKISLMTIADSKDSVTFPVRYNDIEVDSLAAKINDAKTRM